MIRDERTPSAAKAPRLKQIDGLRGPLSFGVIAINMGLYNAGANTPVGVFLVLSGLTSYLAYGADVFDDAARAQFFLRRLVRLLPMLLIATAFQQCAGVLWLIRRGVVIPNVTSGGPFSFVVNLASLLLLLGGSGIVCHGSACGCCRIDRWPRPPCALFWLVFGTYFTGPGWYVGLLLFLNAYFVPKILARYGEAWRIAPPSMLTLVGWALLEALTFVVPLLAYVVSGSSDVWYGATLFVYLGLPPFFRLGTFVFGMQLGRWSLFEVAKAAKEEHGLLMEARTLVPVLATALVVARLHGFLQLEPEMHNPSTGSTPLLWALIRVIHPFNVIALICGLIRAPHSLVARLSMSAPLVLLADLSYAIYLLHYGILTVFVFVFKKRWEAEYERLQATADAPALNALDYVAVVFLSTALAYPATYWIEPRVASWLRARVGVVPPPDSALL